MSMCQVQGREKWKEHLGLFLWSLSYQNKCQSTLASCQETCSVYIYSSPSVAFIFTHKPFDCDLPSEKTYVSHTNEITVIPVTVHRKQSVSHLVLYIILLNVVSVNLPWMSVLFSSPECSFLVCRREVWIGLQQMQKVMHLSSKPVSLVFAPLHLHLWVLLKVKPSNVTIMIPTFLFLNQFCSHWPLKPCKHYLYKPVWEHWNISSCTVIICS